LKKCYESNGDGAFVLILVRRFLADEPVALSCEVEAFYAVWARRWALQSLWSATLPQYSAEHGTRDLSDVTVAFAVEAVDFCRPRSQQVLI
jgi:hypothetical protein